VAGGPGGSIVIVNSDPVMHNTHGFLGKRTVFTSAADGGDEVEKPIKARLVAVECDTHG